MKRLFALVCLSCLAAACGGGDEEIVFYTVDYPVTELDVNVSLPGSADDEEREALIGQITAEVLAEAPVQPGGSYRLDFLRYNGGTLTVLSDPAGAPETGEFVKEPGAAQLQFLFGAFDYTCTVSSYLSDEGPRCVLLTVDLTERYQERYPDAGLTRVQRREYTATPQ